METIDVSAASELQEDIKVSEAVDASVPAMRTGMNDMVAPLHL